MEAGGEVDGEEDVEFEEGCHHEEDGVEEEGDEADLSVEDEGVTGQDEVEDGEGRNEHHGRVLESQGIDLDVVHTLSIRGND